MSPAPVCPAVSSNGFASPGPSPWTPKCCSWTNRARRSTRSPRPRSRRSWTSSSRICASSSSPIRCSKPRACRSVRPSSISASSSRWTRPRRSSPIQPISGRRTTSPAASVDVGPLGVPPMEQQHEHIVRSYEEELELLNNKIAKMGGLAEQVLGQSFEALERRDPDLAAATINEDEEIDELQRQIEEQAVVMIARRQPMAYDLRQIMAALRISADLERIGDLGKNIAKRAVAVVSEQQPKQLMLGLKHMGELALGQLKEVLDAFIERDADRALAVWYKDEEIDAMYNSLFRELLTYMMEDPRNIGLCTHLLFGAKNIERVGDHATNIAETVYYLVHGRAITDQRPKGDTTSTTPVALKRSAV